MDREVLSVNDEVAKYADGGIRCTMARCAVARHAPGASVCSDGQVQINSGFQASAGSERTKAFPFL